MCIKLDTTVKVHYVECCVLVLKDTIEGPTLHNQVEVQGTEEIGLLIRSSTEPALLKSAGSVELLISGTISSVP